MAGLRPDISARKKNEPISGPLSVEPKARRNGAITPVLSRSRREETCFPGVNCVYSVWLHGGKSTIVAVKSVELKI